MESPPDGNTYSNMYNVSPFMEWCGVISVSSSLISLLKEVNRQQLFKHIYPFFITVFSHLHCIAVTYLDRVLSILSYIILQPFQSCSVILFRRALCLYESILEPWIPKNDKGYGLSQQHRLMCASKTQLMISYCGCTCDSNIRGLLYWQIFDKSRWVKGMYK